jgi:hypothetical protein
VEPLAVAGPSARDTLFLERLDGARASHPSNLCARFLTRELFLSFSAAGRERLYRCCRSGAENRDSLVGCYIARPDDLHRFGAFFAPLVGAHHAAGIGLPKETGRLDVSRLGLPALSTRVRLCRNLKGFRLPARMDVAERLRLEAFMTRALQALIDDPAHGGRIYSLSPDLGPGRPNPNLIDARRYRELVASHRMFRRMDEDPYMRSAGLASDWPYGRACYISRDSSVMVWIGEEDHLRIIGMKLGARLADAYDQVQSTLAMLEAMPGMSFLHDETYGYVTSCPSNLGTGLRASARVAMPRRSTSGVDRADACRQVGLTASGEGGDRAPISETGAVDLSPIRRLGLTDRQILEALYDGLRGLAGMISAPEPAVAVLEVG